MNTSPKNIHTYKVAIALGLSIIFWASAFVAIRESLSSFQPGSLALFRFLIASMVLLPAAIIKKMKIPQLKDLPSFLVIGFAGISIYHLALNYGELTVTAATSSFIISSTPILTGIMSIFFLKERIKIWGWIGILISFSGIALITFSEGELGKINWGALLVMVSAICSSLYVIYQKKLLKTYSILEVTTWSIWIGTIFLFIFTPSLLSDFKTASLKDTLGVIYLGIFPAAIAYLLWTYSVSKFKSATHITSFLYLSPIITTLIGIIWLREYPGLYSIIGGLIVLSGVILTNTKGRR